MSDRIYADFAAATPTDPRVVLAMEPFMSENFGNPSSIHTEGKASASAIIKATSQIAKYLNCGEREVVYTSGGTESNNLALFGVAKASRNRGRHIITTAIEHPSIINACRALEKDGWQVTYLPVTSDGVVEVSALEKTLTEETVLVSVHLANSELGVIQDVAELAEVAKKAGAFFHTDACQAGAYLDLDVNQLGVDLLTFNGSKMYGPKGVGALFVREGIDIFPILFGGGQQQSLRSGTENVPGIIGLATACELAIASRDQDGAKINDLRDNLQQQLNLLPGAVVNSANAIRLPNHLSVTLKDARSTNLVEAFDEQGIAVSSGSACSSTSIVDSNVLQAIGLSGKDIHKTIRISLGRGSTRQNIDRIVEVAQKI